MQFTFLSLAAPITHVSCTDLRRTFYDAVINIMYVINILTHKKHSLPISFTVLAIRKAILLFLELSLESRKNIYQPS